MNELALYRVGNNLWLTLMALALLEAISIHVWRYRREPGALPLIGIQLCRAVWLLGLLLLSLSQRLSTQIVALDISILATTAMSCMGFRFLAELQGLRARVLRWIDGMNLAILAACTAGMVLLFLQGRVSSKFWVRVSLGLSFIYAALVVRWAIRERGLRRRQAQIVLLSICVTWGTWRLSQIEAIRAMGSLPIGFAISGLLITWAFLRWRLVGLMPLAQETVFRERIDALLMLDFNGRILALNPFARALFPSVRLAEGDSIGKAIDDWPELAVLAEKNGECRFDAVRRQASGRMVYEVTQTPVRNSVGSSLGRAVTLTDVTEERREHSHKLQLHGAASMLEERRRLGRELHDSSQVWSFLFAQSQNVQHLLAHSQPARAQQIVDRMVEVLAENSFGLRESMLGLQSELSEEHDLPVALEEQLDWYRRHCAMNLQLHMAQEWRPTRVPLEAQAQLLRIAQEALANARKHAQAQNIAIALQLEANRLRMSVADDGRGFDAAAAAELQGHFGLRTMRERATSIGAQFHLDAAPDAGCRIHVDLPLA